MNILDICPRFLFDPECYRIVKLLTHLLIQSVNLVNGLIVVWLCRNYVRSGRNNLATISLGTYFNIIFMWTVEQRFSTNGRVKF